MNIQTPWIFFPAHPSQNQAQAVAVAQVQAHHQHHQSLQHIALNNNLQPTTASSMGLIPLNYPPQLIPHSLPPGANLGGTTFQHVPSQHPHHHHPPGVSAHNQHSQQHQQQQQLQLLAAAAMYEQQCSSAAVATRFLHQSQQLQQQQHQQHQHQISHTHSLPSLHHHHHQHPLSNGYSHHVEIGQMHQMEDGTIGGSSAATKRKLSTDGEDSVIAREIKKAKLETKALKAKRPGFTDDRYNETSYFVENGLRKVYPYYFTFTTFTKGRWVGEKILDVFAREFRAHPVEEYERCIKTGTLTVNYEKVETDYRLKHNDLLANIVHRHEVPVTADRIEIVHMDEDLVVVNKPASIPVHPCGRYRHNTIVFILAKEYQLKNLRTIHRLDRLTSGLLLFGRSPKKAREMEQQIRNRVVSKEYVCRVEGEFPDEEIECSEPILVVSYKIGVCKVSKEGKDCKTVFKKLSSNGKTSVVSAKPRTGRMHQIRVHLQYLGFPIVNDPLYNHSVFGPEKGKGGNVGKSDEQLIQDLISIHNAENWLGIEGEESGGGDMFGMPQPARSPTPTALAALDNPSASLLSTLSQDETQEIEPARSNGDDSTFSSPSGIITEKENNNEVSSPKSFTSCDQLIGTAAAITSCSINSEKDVEEPIKSCDKKDTLTSGACKGKVTVGTQTCRDQDEIDQVACSTMTTHNANSTTTLRNDNDVVDDDQEDTPSSGTGSILTATKDNNNFTFDPNCLECKVRYRDPKPNNLIMYLHAIRYGGPEWQYETKLPDWASADWVEPD